MDFNADGKVDYFTATFDGSPHVAYGTDDGCAEPGRLHDRSGKRVMLDQYWDYDEKEWANSGSDNGHCTSALAFDWDNDGDYDLLLGSYGDGNLHRQMNEGSPGAPSFTGVSVPVLAGGAPFALEGGITAPRLVDWDGDGLMDLVIGSYGESYTSEPPGGVYLYRNCGELGAPKFEAASALIAPTATAGHAAERPNVGLYADPVDYDGDGDLDLVVGGYSIWTPEAPVLTAAMKARLAELEELIPELTKLQRDLMTKALADSEELDEKERRVFLKAAREASTYKETSAQVRDLRAERERLSPSRQRVASVWVYLQVSS